MAKIGLGVIVAQIRGKVGGGVFTKARNGATLRTRITPSNPRTAAQSGVRSYLTEASRAFKSLGASDLADWRAYALGVTQYNPISGTTFHPSAIALFVALASKFLQVNPAGVIPVTPPAAPFDGEVLTVTGVGGAGIITYTGTDDNTVGVKTELLYQKLPSANRVPNPKGYKHAGFTAVPQGTPFVAGSLPAGTYVPAYKFVKTATGQQSPIVVLPAVTVS